MTYVGRFAPSPTGRLHLGNARSALLGWLDARAHGGKFLLRIEDLDPERSKEEFVDAIKRDLEYLGLTWDGPVVRQRERSDAYRDALADLEARGRVYRCSCSRADILRASSAPHAGEEGPRYPGTCRAGPTAPGRPTSKRFLVEPGITAYVDRLAGPVAQDVEAMVGDFVVARADGVASYQLAVVVDDAASGVTHVVRADDLKVSTPRQLQLLRALGQRVPSYAHVPLILGDDGQRMAKRTGSATVSYFREAGVPAEQVVGALASWSGLADGGPCSAQSLVAGFRLESLPREPTRVTEEALNALGKDLR